MSKTVTFKLRPVALAFTLSWTLSPFASAADVSIQAVAPDAVVVKNGASAPVAVFNNARQIVIPGLTMPTAAFGTPICYDTATGTVGPCLPGTGVGPTGPAGPAGAAGATGATGAVGAVGPTGAAGPVGPAGATGASGATGAVGPVGPTGSAGAVGAVGPAGATGAVGPVGSVGPAGATGATGTAGPIGAAGPAGAPGTPGAPGSPGLLGAIGPAGPAGPIGAPGLAGADGVPGAAGPAGPAGADGVAGPAGADGAAGPAGPTGPAGSSGGGAIVGKITWSSPNPTGGFAFSTNATWQSTFGTSVTFPANAAVAFSLSGQFQVLSPTSSASTCYVGVLIDGVPVGGACDSVNKICPFSQGSSNSAAMTSHGLTQYGTVTAGTHVVSLGVTNAGSGGLCSLYQSRIQYMAVPQ